MREARAAAAPGLVVSAATSESAGGRVGERLAGYVCGSRHDCVSSAARARECQIFSRNERILLY